MTPTADANLHLIIAQLTTGAETMRQAAHLQEGATQVLGALQHYTAFSTIRPLKQLLTNAAGTRPKAPALVGSHAPDPDR